MGAQTPVFIGYLRVSLEEQAKTGYGLTAQRNDIRAEAERRKWLIEWVEDAGKSGKSMKRDGLTYALGRLRDGHAAGLIVSKLDRLSRSLLDFLTIVEHAQKEGWSLVVLSPQIDLTTPGGRAMAHMLATFAQFERELIAQRVREGLAVARAQGKQIGAPKRITPDVMNRMRREHDAGGSLHAIARGLNDDGVPTALGGKEWYPATVRAALLRDP